MKAFTAKYTVWRVSWSDRLLMGNTGYEAEKPLCQCDEGCVCLLSQTPAGLQPVPLPASAFSPAAVTPSSFHLCQDLDFFCLVSCPFYPPPTTIHGCVSPSEWYRLQSSALDSSHWQPPQPDDRKQTPEQRLDVNGPWFLLVMALCLFVWGLTEVSLHAQAGKNILGFILIPI